MSEGYVIGVDHGYAAMKTVHGSFPSGLVAYEHEPYTQKNVLEYSGTYYVVGSGRQPLQKDKTRTEDYYLLTLAAIARELDCRNAERTCSVILAAGLPLTSFGRDKKKFRAYLLRDGKPVPFRYEGRDYTVTVRDVKLFPQGYAAVLTQTELLDEPSVIVADIGGWTVDLMRLDNRLPNAATCRSLEWGMIRCIDEISEQVRRVLGLSLTTAQIECVLRGDASSLPDEAKGIIHAQADLYVQNLLSTITECGLDTRAMPTIFIGGGAALMKRRVSATNGLCRPVILDDVSLNAKGYHLQFRKCGYRREVPQQCPQLLQPDPRHLRPAVPGTRLVRYHGGQGRKGGQLHRVAAAEQGPAHLPLHAGGRSAGDYPGCQRHRSLLPHHGAQGI